MKGVNKKTRLIIIALILIECFSIFLTYKSFENKKISEDIKKYTFNKNTFAIFVEKDGNYEEIKDGLNKWPNTATSKVGDAYIFNETNSYCVNSNNERVDNVLSFNNVLNEAVVVTKQTVFCYLYFDERIDIKINVSTNNISGKVPNTLGYLNDINCNNTANAIWDYKNNRMLINSIYSNNAECNLKFTNDTNTHKSLISKVKEEKDRTIINNGICTNELYTTQGTCEAAGYSWWGVFDEGYSDLLNGVMWTQINSKDNYNVISNDSTVPFVITNKNWTLSSSASSKIEFSIDSTGYYRVCYEVLASNESAKLNSLTFYSPNSKSIKNSFSVNASTSDKIGCFDYGQLHQADTIYISGYHYNNNVSFYFMKTNNYEMLSTGLRYAGKNPNNYVWFNDELWRIIGYVPAKDKDLNDINLVKIIKANQLGFYSYNNGSSQGDFENTKIKSLLNNIYYYSSNGTDSDMCYAGWNNNAKAKCDFTNSGLTTLSRTMIKAVKWPIGFSETTYSSSMWNTTNLYYINEHKKFTSNEINISLINASDYGYATLKNDCQYIDLDSGHYAKDNCIGKNWLFQQGSNRTITPYGNNGTWAYLNINGGNLSQFGSMLPIGISPVVYLKEGVYFTTGDGSINNPYILGM